VLYARHKSGELAGFTQMFYDPENPENLDQGNTGVAPKYRGHRLGKWLKAAMLQKVFAERPTAKHVRTGNADSNAPMLAINHALGFKPYIAHTVWQIEVEKIKAYLQNKSL
jgi:mycothiol synthase